MCDSVRMLIVAVMSMFYLQIPGLGVSFFLGYPFFGGFLRETKRTTEAVLGQPAKNTPNDFVSCQSRRKNAARRVLSLVPQNENAFRSQFLL